MWYLRNPEYSGRHEELNFSCLCAHARWATGRRELHHLQDVAAAGQYIRACMPRGTCVHSRCEVQYSVIVLLWHLDSHEKHGWLAAGRFCPLLTTATHIKGGRPRCHDVTLSSPDARHALLARLLIPLQERRRRERRPESLRCLQLHQRTQGSSARKAPDMHRASCMAWCGK